MTSAAGAPSAARLAARIACSRSGFGHPVREVSDSGVADPVAPGDQLGDDAQHRIHMPVGGRAENATWPVLRVVSIGLLQATAVSPVGPAAGAIGAAASQPLPGPPSVAAP